MFQVKFTAEANEDLRQLRKFDQVKILQAIRSQLTDREIIRTRQNKELMAFLEERAKQPATIPLEEIERELGLR